MKTILQELDELIGITVGKPQRIAKNIRNLFIRSEKYADKLEAYFTDTLDGMDVQKAKIKNKL